MVNTSNSKWITKPQVFIDKYHEDKHSKSLGIDLEVSEFLDLRLILVKNYLSSKLDPGKKVKKRSMLHGR